VIFKGNFTKVFLIQSILFILLVVLSDITLWALSPVSEDHQRIESFLRQNIPGLKRSIKYESGIYGLRMKSEFDVVKPKNLVRILCLGASTTQQSTQETQDTWCGIIETELRKHFANSKLKIQTVAYGRGGLRASDNAQWLIDNIDNIDPDIVITLLGINDLALNGGEGYEYSGFKEPVFENEDEKGWCNKYSQICRRINHIIENQLAKKKIKTGEVVQWHSAQLRHLTKKYRELPYIENIARNPDPISEFRDVTRWIMEYLKQKDVQVIVLGQPVLWKDNFDPEEQNSLWFSVSTQNGPVRPPSAWLKEEMEKYNSVQKLLAKQSGFSYIDMDNRIPKTLEYYFDDCHFTDIGSNAVAINILPALIETIEDTGPVRSHLRL